MEPSTLAVVIAVGAASLACEVHLWTRPVRPLAKLLWTPVVVLPLLGPIFYGALFGGAPPVRDAETPFEDVPNGRLADDD